MTELSPEARRLLDDACHDDRPPAGAKDRARGALQAALVAGAVAVPVGASALTKLLAVAVVAGSVGGGTWFVHRAISAQSTQSTSTRPDPTPAPSPAQATETTETAQPGPTRAAAPAPAPARKAVVAARPPPSACALPDELALLREAQSALDRGETAQSLAVLERHAARCPNGALAEERAATRVLALCQGGRLSEGAAELSAFKSSAPRSPHLRRLEAACTSETAP